MFTFSEMLALVQSESSFGAFIFHRRPAGLQATSDLVTSKEITRSDVKIDVEFIKHGLSVNVDVNYALVLEAAPGARRV